METNQIRFGLMPILDAAQTLKRTVLPLKSVHYRFVVRGGMAEVELTQVYCQENDQPLDCEYLFPLPADGAVYSCESIINGRVIRAQVEEREAAREIAAKKKAEGHRTALVESERDNLFTLSLGNVQPRDVVEVKLAYLQPLRRLAGQVALDLPLCPGVRYIPGKNLLRSNQGSGVVDDTDQVPDASRITPPRIDAEHPDAAVIQLEGQLEAGFLDGEVSSPSHQLKCARNAGMLQLTLARGGEVPDHDLALRWKERDVAHTSLRGWVSQHNGSNYALLELRAPATVESTDAIAQDVYFLVDRSGSMNGPKWQKAIEALHACVRVLGSKDRVAVTLFESSFQDFGSEPVSPAALLADPRFRRLAEIGTTGGTEMEPALRHALEMAKKVSHGRPTVLVLITDAEIGNEQEIIALMRQHPSLPVHCFGIDTTLNDSLLLDLVRQQGGTFHAMQPNDDVAGIVAQLGRTLRQPVLVDLRLPGDWELASGSIPNLYAGQIHSVSVRSKAGPGATELTVLARDPHNTPVTLEFKLASVPEAGPRLRWCKERLVSLVAKEANAEAVKLSKESNLLCRLTAFVAWDEQEKVTVASHRLVQPTLTPEYSTCAPRCHAPAARMAFMPALPSRDFDSVLLRQADREPDGKLLYHELSRLQKRIQDFIAALGNAIPDSKCLKLLRDCQEWLRQSPDCDSIHLFDALLDECERNLKELIDCQLHLREEADTTTGRLERLAQIFRSLSAKTGGRPRPEDQRPEIPGQGVRDLAGQIARLENQIRDRIGDFAHSHLP